MGWIVVGFENEIKVNSGDKGILDGFFGNKGDRNLNWNEIFLYLILEEKNY